MYLKMHATFRRPLEEEHEIHHFKYPTSNVERQFIHGYLASH